MVGNQPELRNAASSPSGVLGWLLVLCVSLTLFTPVFEARIGIRAFKNLVFQSGPSNLTSLRLLIVGVVYTGLAIASCWAGIWLWLKDWRAVAFAKAYLVTSAVLVIGLQASLMLAGMHINLPKIIFSRLVYSGTWFSYLQLSRRVRNTYFLDSAVPKPATMSVSSDIS